MATMKRRIVYMSDRDWADLQESATRREMTVSALIRERVFDDDHYFAPERPRKRVPVTELTEAQRKAVGLG